jgi:hypothetical protein
MKLAKRLHKGTAAFTLATMTLLPLKTLTTPLALGVATAGVAVTAAAPAQAATQQIPASTIADILNAALSGSEIRLNSFGTQNHYSWHRADDSYVSLFGFRKSFNLPELTARAGKFRYSYNVNNITSRNIRLTPQGDAFELTMIFQTNGSAIKGLCRGPKGLRECVIGKDKAAPDVSWNNPHIKVRLVPQVSNGGLVLSATQVTVGGEFNVGGICNLLGQGFCNSLLNHRERIRLGVETAVLANLNDARVSQTTAQYTRQGLSRLGVGPLQSVTMSGNQVTVTY